MKAKHFLIIVLVIYAFVSVSGQDSEIQKVDVIAHRGGIVPEISENTIPAFKNCVELGVDAIELDLRSTRDREIIILHDEYVDRTTNGSGPVNNLTLAEVKRLDAGQGYSIPSFEEVVKLIKGNDIKLLLDLKEQDHWYRQEIAKHIEKYNVSDQIIIGARSLEDVKYFRQFDKHLKILGFIPDVEAIQPFIGNGADIIRFWPGWMEGNESPINFCEQNSIPIWVTVGNKGKDEIKALLNHGITGFIHDSPGKLMDILGGLE